MAPGQWNWFSMESFNKYKACVVYLVCSAPFTPDSERLHSDAVSLTEKQVRRTAQPPRSMSSKVFICGQRERWKRKDLPKVDQIVMENNGLDSYCGGRARTDSRNNSQGMVQGPGCVLGFQCCYGSEAAWTSHINPFQKSVFTIVILSLIPFQLSISRSKAATYRSGVDSITRILVL